MIEARMPSWLMRKKEELEMDEMMDPLPPVAALPEPPRSNGTHHLTLHEAAEKLDQYAKDQERWKKLAEDAAQRIKDLERAKQFYELELLQEKNDKQTLQTMVYELQQKNADLRALQSELYALAMHVVARYEHNEISLPVRKKAKGNGDKKEVTEPANPSVAKIIDKVADQA